MSDVGYFVAFYILSYLCNYIIYAEESNSRICHEICLLCDTPTSSSKKTELSKKSRAESRKLPGNLELSAFLCTFAHDNSNS